MDFFEKRQFIKKVITTIIILLLIAGGLTGATLAFSQKADLLGWINALFFSGFLIFAFGWLMIVTNAHLFTVLFYGVRQFVMGLLGRKPNQDIIEYRDSRRSVPKYIIITTFIIGLIFIIISVAIYLFTK